MSDSESEISNASSSIVNSIASEESFASLLEHFQETRDYEVNWHNIRNDHFGRFARLNKLEEECKPRCIRPPLMVQQSERYPHYGLERDPFALYTNRETSRERTQTKLAMLGRDLRNEGIKRYFQSTRRGEHRPTPYFDARANELVQRISKVDTENLHDGNPRDPTRSGRIPSMAIELSGDSEDIRDIAFRDFFDAVKIRCNELARDLHYTISTTAGPRFRWIHDSLNYRRKANDSEFTEILRQIQTCLSSSAAAAIGFHTDNDIDYDYKTNRGTSPNFDRCVLGRGTFNRDNAIFTFQAKPQAQSIGEVYQHFTYQENEFTERTESLVFPKSGHFHIVHLCKWQNHQCRCLSRYFDLNKRKNKNVTTDDITFELLRNQMLYFAKWPRWLVYCKVSDAKIFRFVPGTESFREEALRPREQNELEECPNTPEMRLQVYQPGSSDDTHSLRPATRQNSKSSAKTNHIEKLLSYLKERPCYPLDDILKTRDWLEGPYKTWTGKDKTVQRAFSILMRQIMYLSYQELLSLYQSEGCRLIWAAPGSTMLFDFYHTLEESIEIVEKLLDWQLDHEERVAEMNTHERKKWFCTQLFNICERKIPKVNTFEIIGDPGCGKTYFTDAIMAFYWNSGHVLNFNKYQAFPLMNAVNRRLNFWNEPNFEPNAIDDIKKLTGGDKLPTPYKHEVDACINKTPLIINSQERRFPNKEEFYQRIISFSWTQAPFLKTYDKKLYPMVWPYLVDTYVFSAY